MRFVRSPVICLFLTISATHVYGQSDGKLNTPQLGPIILLAVDSNEPGAPRLLPGDPQLGEIVPIAAFLEAEPEGLIPPAPPFESDEIPEVRLAPAHAIAAIPCAGVVPVQVIARPMPAPIGEPFAYASVPIPRPAHPEEIHAQLSTVAAQLAAAGLIAEAQKLHEFQLNLDRDHSQRLLIAFKEAQIRDLEAEVEFLKRNPHPVANDVQVRLQLRFIEVNAIARGALVSRINGEELTNGARLGTFVDNVDSQVICQLVETLCRQGDAKVVSEPRCIVFDGQSVQMAANSQNTPPIIAAIGDETGVDESRLPLGTSVCVTPKIVGPELIQLLIGGEYGNIELSRTACPIPATVSEFHVFGVSRNLGGMSRMNDRHKNLECRTDRIEAFTRVGSGQTTMVIGNPRCRRKADGSIESDSSLLLMVTPEIVPCAATPFSAPAPVASGRLFFEARTMSYPSVR